MLIEDKRFESILSERIIILIVIILLAFLWSLNLLSGFAALLIGGCISLLLIQLEIKEKIETNKKRQAEIAQRRDSKRTGIRSVRANTLNGVPMPIMIVNEAREIAFANLSAQELLGKNIVDDDVFKYLKQSKFVKAFDKIFVDNQKTAGEVRFRNKRNRSFDVTVTRVSGTGKNDVPTQVMVFFYEVTSLLQTEQMRVDFVANASHELRTPLSSVIGFIETLQGPAKDDESARERFLNIMQSEAERMVRLIDDLLSLSKIEMSRHVAPDTKVDLKNLVEGVAISASEIGRKRDVKFITHVDEAAGSTIADQDQITQVLLNLTINAAKYADSNSTVHVSAELVGGKKKMVEISVRDEGPGISTEHLARLTERFYRVDDARSRQMGGTGLGLAIVKHILLRHDSQLEIESTVGVGTTFSFRLSHG